MVTLVGNKFNLIEPGMEPSLVSGTDEELQPIIET
jgi:hypothetical protein